jgi:hypothetical protein
MRPDYSSHAATNFIFPSISVIYKNQPNRPQNPAAKLKPMTTPAQIAANQKNAQLSSGPRTDAGKASSSLNSVAHALSSTFRVLMHETQVDFDALKQRITEEQNPEGDHETFLVEQMVQSRWKLLRIQRLENVAYDYILMGEDPSQSDDPDAKIIAAMSKKDRDPLALLERYRITAERAYYKAHRELMQNRGAAAKEQGEVTKQIIQQSMFGPTPGQIMRLAEAGVVEAVVLPETETPLRI